jgi:hypothetical protein
MPSTEFIIQSETGPCEVTSHELGDLAEGRSDTVSDEFDEATAEIVALKAL